MFIFGPRGMHALILCMHRQKVLTTQIVLSYFSTGKGNIASVLCFKFISVPHVALTDIFILRSVQNNSNNGNNRNIDLRLDSFKIRSAWNKGNIQGVQ